jgi:hypothetical protein
MVKGFRDRFRITNVREEIFGRLRGGDRLHYYVDEARGLSVRLKRLITLIE